MQVYLTVNQVAVINMVLLGSESPLSIWESQVFCGVCFAEFL